MKHSDHLQAVLDEFARCGAVVTRLENGGKHPRVYFRIGGRVRFYVVPNTPSDRRAWLNARSQIRGLCGYVPPAKTPKTKRRKQRRETMPALPKRITPGPDPFACLAGLAHRFGEGQ